MKYLCGILVLHFYPLWQIKTIRFIASLVPFFFGRFIPKAALDKTSVDRLSGVTYLKTGLPPLLEGER